MCSDYELFVADLLESKNSQGMTPLFQSVSCNNLECVQFLVMSGANIDTRDNVGRTPVALAAYQVRSLIHPPHPHTHTHCFFFLK